MQGIGPTSVLHIQGLDSPHEEERSGERVRFMKKNVLGGKAEKRISVDGIGGVFIQATDAKALSNWYAHHFGLKLETYEDGKVYGTEFKYRRLSDSSKVDSTVFSITQSKVPLASERTEAVINYRVRDLPAPKQRAVIHVERDQVAIVLEALAGCAHLVVVLHVFEDLDNQPVGRHDPSVVVDQGRAGEVHKGTASPG